MEQEVRLKTPSRVPVLVAWGLAAVFLAAGLWSQAQLWQADLAVARVEAAAASSVAPMVAQRQLLRDLKAARAETTAWQRRRLGWLLAAAVLAGGGFIADGLRKLHERMAWAFLATPPEEE